MQILNLAIISDLHAFDDAQGKDDPSYLSLALPENQPARHPISGLVQLINEEGLKADLLLCAGDIGDKARPIAIQYAWRCIQRVREALNARLAGVTTGNHDCDSRHQYNDFDAKGMLQGLVPPYPLPDEAQNDRYWSRNFVIVEEECYRLVILNSSAYHGQTQMEVEHGRVADSTLDRLKSQLCEATSKPVNILLCHHHPKPHSELQLGESDIMRNGQQLLDLLGSGRFGSWLVVHGHKHHPKLSYAEGGGSAPVVFAAGSLCAVLKPPVGSRVRNQFYTVSIPLHLIDDFGLVGIVKAWDWAPGTGWSPAVARAHLPAVSGFGYRASPMLLARKLARVVVEDRMDWNQVQQAAPEVDFLIPQDVEALRYHLENVHQIGIVMDEIGMPRQIGRIR